MSDLMSIGRTMLGRRHVLPAVPFSLTELMVEGTFPSGTYLVTVHDPISTEDGDLSKALYGSFLPIPSQDIFPSSNPGVNDLVRRPGAVIPVKNARMTFHGNRERRRLKIVNKGDRPIQVRKSDPLPYHRS